MSSDNFVIRVSDLTKRYEIYDSPSGRLKQFLMPRLRKFFRLKEKCYFRDFYAVQNVSFEVKQGQTIGIVGRNGSGKSTLLQMICGTLNPTVGTVETRGRIAALLELGSGFNPEFSGRENIYMNAALYGLSTSQTNNRLSKIIEFADIGEFIDQPVKTYSSGMYVRLAFSIIAHIDADVLVIDEALAVGDVFFTQKCMRFLRHFMKTGVVLFVSHDTSSILSLCTHAIWLDKGQTQKVGLPRDVCEAYLQEAYESEQGKILDKSQVDKSIEKSFAETVVLADVLKKEDHMNGTEISGFTSDGVSFGKGGATILSVKLLSEIGKSLGWIEGGELVTLDIKARINFTFDSPIVGFFVKDHLGQMLFGENTYLDYKETRIDLKPGDTLSSQFTFRMPLLPGGTYSVTISIASGSQIKHEQQHWIHDALIFRSISNRTCNGLVGLPMLKVALQVYEP